MESYLQRMVTVQSCSLGNFKQLAEFSGSENEREAHRKNRVMQMRLVVCLSEITLQQRSSAQIHKMEEVRFLQKAKHRRSQPQSARMLAQFRSRQSQGNKSPSSGSSSLTCANDTAPSSGSSRRPCANNTVPAAAHHAAHMPTTQLPAAAHHVAHVPTTQLPAAAQHAAHVPTTQFQQRLITPPMCQQNKARSHNQIVPGTRTITAIQHRRGIFVPK